MIEASLTRLLAALSVVFCALVVPARAGQDLQPIADRFVKLLRTGDTAKVAALLHYPPAYSPEERATDEGGVRKQLDFLLQRFGGISRAAPAKEWPETVDLGVSGGTISYFASLGKISSVDLVYAASCERMGATVLKVSFLQTDRGWEAFKVSFGIPSSKPEARALAEEIGKQLAAHMGPREAEL